MKVGRSAGLVPAPGLEAATDPHRPIRDTSAEGAAADVAPTPTPAPQLATAVRDGAGGRPRAGLKWAAVATTLAAVLSLVLLAAQLHPFLGDYGDDAEFLVLGQSLATGQGYAWVNGPERPAHNRYPPGYPLLLAVTMLVSGTSAEPFAAVIPAKLVTAATFLASGLLLWPLARRRLPAPWAAGAVALYLLNPFAIRFAVQTMSDMPYVLAFLAALVWADRLGTGEGESRATRSPLLATRNWIVLGLLLALGAYVRSIGLVAAAGVLAWAWWRGWRTGSRGWLWAAGAFVAVMLPWWWRDASLAGGWRYIEELLAAQYLDPQAGTVGSGDLMARVVSNASFLVGKPGVFGLLGMVAGLAASTLVFLGFVRCLRTQRAAAEWAVVAVVVAVLFWPIKTGRYLLPVVPLAGIYAIGGTLLAADWVARRAPRPEARRLAARVLPASFGAGLVLLAVMEGAYAGREALANVRLVGEGNGAAGYYRDRPLWAHYLQAADWLRQNAAPGDVALARRHFALYVYSGRYVDKYRFDTPPDEMAYLLSGSMRKFVVQDAFDELRGDFAPLPAALRARGGDLVLRFETAPPAVRVWELVRPAD
jgi:hypothetical protein